MKKRIWYSFSLLVVVVSLIITVIYPLSIQGALEEQTYEMIKEEQRRYAMSNQNLYTIPDSEFDFIERREAARSIGHLLIVNDRGKLQGDYVPEDVLQTMAQNAFSQEGSLGQYDLAYKGATLFYVVRKTEFAGQHAYLISYMWDTYRNEMVEMLWGRLVWIVLLAGILGLALAAWLAGYLRRPLVLLGERFEEIAQRNWKKSFRWEEDDEFGHLSQQFEHMRQNLLRYDQAQQTFIQHASHELKTPVMVINSYAESVKDGIYPKDNIEESMDVIIEESGRMEQRVKELLYYTKLGSLKDETPQLEETTFGEAVGEIAERLSLQRTDIAIVMKGEDVPLLVDRDQCKVLFENLLENALRYAEGEIRLEALERESSTDIIFINDGDTVPDEEIVHLFDPFYKGAKGKFGLGLAIVKRIVELHRGEINVKNMGNGVGFVVSLPKNLVQ